MNAIPALAVTTSAAANEDLAIRGRRLADELGLAFVHRQHKQGLVELIGRDARAFLVMEKSGLALADEKSRLKWSPQLAALRIGRLSAGFMEDKLVQIAEFKTGDRVLDCTLGLGQDALVAAHVIGTEGSVVALEKSTALFAVAADGLNRYRLAQPGARIDVHHADCAIYLRDQPTGSFDVVLFDPMFERPRKSTPAFEMLRRYADHAPLTLEMVNQARRVARRCVVIKGSRYSRDFKKLNVDPEPASPFATVLWARLGPVVP